LLADPSMASARQVARLIVQKRARCATPKTAVGS